jgi:hypothetical protein
LGDAGVQTEHSGESLAKIQCDQGPMLWF